MRCAAAAEARCVESLDIGAGAGHGPPMNENKTEDAKRLLLQLKQILKLHNDRNWMPGVEAALAAIFAGKFKEAASAYKGLKHNKKSFGQWSIHKVDPRQRTEVNKPLDDVRNKLAEIFGE